MQADSINSYVNAIPKSDKGVIRMEDKATGARLIILCTVCVQPLLISKEHELAIKYANSFTCPACNQSSPVTKELKDYIHNTLFLT